MGMSMTSRERELYHQIHPVKLAVDWGAGLVSAILLWRHRLAAAMIWGLVPPAVVSVPFMLGVFDATLHRYRSSSLGRYVACSMSLAMQGLRLLGLAVLWLGAWYQQPLAIALGLNAVTDGGASAG